MSDLRKPYVRTAFAGLGSNPDQEKPIDILGAAGKCKAMGIDLWRSAFGLETSAYHRLRKDLLKAFRKRYPRETLAEKIVDQAIHEFFGPGCETCTGTGKVGLLQLDKPQTVCPTCNGDMKGRFNNERRSIMMQVSWGKVRHIGFKITWVIKLMSNFDQHTNITMNNQLERER